MFTSDALPKGGVTMATCRVTTVRGSVLELEGGIFRLPLFTLGEMFEVNGPGSELV